MHGRKKAVKPPTEEERAVTATKVVKYRALEAAVLEMVCIYVHVFRECEALSVVEDYKCCNF